MQIGIISDEIGRSPVTQVKLLKRLREEGIPVGVEIRSLWGKYPPQLEIAEAEQAARMFREAGIPMHGIAGGLGKCDLHDEKAVEAHLETIPHLARIADIFGTDKIRMFFGFRWQDSRSMCDTVQEFGKRALDTLPQNKVFIVENEPATNAGMLDWIVEMILRLDNLDNPRMKILFDLGNYLYAVETMMALGRVNVDVNRVIERHILAHSGYIGLVHIKNLRRGEDPLKPDTVDLDKGMINIPKLLRILKDSRYKGAVDLESHRRRKGQQISEAARLKPGGKGYGDPVIAEKDIRMLHGWVKQLSSEQQYEDKRG
jgi:sugar phosphate isomerase/epimerase